MSHAAASVVVVFVVAVLAMAAGNPTGGQGGAASEEARELEQQLEQKRTAKTNKLEEIHKAIDEMEVLSKDHKAKLKDESRREEFMKVIIDSLATQSEMVTIEDEADEIDEELESVRRIPVDTRNRLVGMFDGIEGEIASLPKQPEEKKEEDLSDPAPVPVPGLSGDNTATPKNTMHGSSTSMTANGAVLGSAVALGGVGTIAYHAYKGNLKKGQNKVIGYLRKPLSKVPAGAVPSPEPRSTPMTVGKVAGAAAATAAITGAGTVGYFAYRENDLAKGWNKAVEKTKNVANAGLQTPGLQKKPAQTPPEGDRATSSATGPIVSVGAVVACTFAALA